MKDFILIFLLILSFCNAKLPAQQMAHNNTDAKPVLSVYEELDQITKQISSDPTNEEFLNKRALIYLKMNEFDKALSDIATALSSHPQSDRLYYTRALILIKRKNYDSALESIDKAIEIKSNENNLFLRASLYALRNETREAILDLNSILSMNPRCDYCYLQKALWCHDLNMFYEEIKNFLYYLELSQDETNKGIVKKRLKRMQQSDKYYRDLIRFAKKDIRKNGYPWEYQSWQ